MTTKKISAIHRRTESHWVGDGFPVNTLLSYDAMGESISPFLLLDYAGPAYFEPSKLQRGVGTHPHRGFETVTIVYDGEVEHKDSAGNAGKIGPGDVQWMTAAHGVLHEERHSKAFSEHGGMLEMIQLWVNLPAKDKMSAPKYQEILNRQIPVVNLPNQAGTARIIAGQFDEVTGAASTFTPVNLWDVRLNAGSKVTLTLPEQFNTAILVLKGTVKINGDEALGDKELALFEQNGDQVELEASDNAVLLVLNGKPLNEPIAGHGLFVMNTRAEINQAIMDFQLGRF